ncbi:MAG: hypothetical protein WBA93_35665 [Microcoleaceae cyanobacterium]
MINQQPSHNSNRESVLEELKCLNDTNDAILQELKKLNQTIPEKVAKAVLTIILTLAAISLLLKFLARVF